VKFRLSADKKSILVIFNSFNNMSRGAEIT
jgi:hypothetical protein